MNLIILVLLPLCFICALASTTILLIIYLLEGSHMVHVEMLFVKPGATPLTYIKDLEFLLDLGSLEIESKILSLPFISIAEDKGFTLKAYNWHIA